MNHDLLSNTFVEKIVHAMTNEMIQLKLTQYMDLYGQKEAVSLMQKLGSSKLFMDNINIAIQRHEVPNSKTINNIIHSSHISFLLAGKRKIYFASLFFLLTLYRNYEQLGFPIDELGFSRSLLEICEDYVR
ncbi:MAG: hypothetical protein GC171_15445 [Terrimonas sp.]|nr:hypothetical protein [Terrimonas sp.]